MRRVEGFQASIRQFGNLQRIAARFHCICRALEKMLADAMIACAQRIRKRIFHLVKHDALEHQLILYIYQALAFLLKIAVIERRKKRGIQIHVKQVMKIRFVLACK